MVLSVPNSKNAPIDKKQIDNKAEMIYPKLNSNNVSFNEG